MSQGRTTAAVLGLVLAALVARAGAPARPNDRVAQYLGLAQATLERPITPSELDAALLSHSGVEDVAALFEKSLSSSLMVAGSVVTPELGGEATLEQGRLRFAESADALHPVVRRMVELKGDPKALLDWLEATPTRQEVLTTTGGLHALLFQLARRPPTSADLVTLESVLANAVHVHFKTWTIDPLAQQAMIAANDWSGRYVGFWHLHPPRPAPSGYGPGFEPSHEDMTIAVEHGQLLTLVFQADGFDGYDLGAMARAGGPDLSKARVIRHRSAGWKRRFSSPRQ